MDKFEQFSKISNGLLGYATDALFGNTTKPSDKIGHLIIIVVIILVFSILIILLYAGTEVVFLLTRKNFGSKGIKKFRSIAAALTFFGLAYYCHIGYNNYYGEIMLLGSDITFWLAARTFLFIGFFVLIRGIIGGGKDDLDVISPIYRGDSWLLGGLVKEKWPQSLIQDFAEPLLFVAIGLYLTSFNYVWGIPFIFCGVSCWFHLGVESVTGFFNMRKDLSNEGLTHANNYRISQIVD